MAIEEPERTERSPATDGGEARIGRKWWMWQIWWLILLLAVLPTLALWAGIDRSGTDDRAMEMIEQIKPGYQPWATPLFEPSERLERALFLLQALGGAGALLYLLRRLSRKQPVPLGEGRRRARGRRG